MPLLAPSGTTITLSSNSTIVQSNGSAQISATMLESSGTPVQNGTTVTFSTNLGKLTPSEARTLNGVATVQFQAAGASGVAEIRATSGAAKPSDATNPSVKITIGAAAAGRISVTATPATVPATGGTSAISAAVLDTAGNALRDVAVTFSATAGTLSTSVATTDANGNATTTLTTNRETTVTASTGAGATAGANTAAVVVRVNVAGAVAVTATPSPALVGQAVAISVALTPSASGSAFQRGTVEFGDGSSTTIGGSSTTVQHTYTRTGSYVIRATVFDQLGDSATSTVPLQVNNLPRPTVSISAAATPPPTAGAVTAFTVGVTAGTGGGAIESVKVTFGDGTSVNLGGATGTQQIQHVYQTSGTFTATVEAEDSMGATGTASTVIVVQPVLVSLSYVKGSTNLTANFTATVTPSGTAVSSYVWNFGDGSPPQTTAGNTNSRTYVAGTYTASVTATTPNGQTASSSTTVTIPIP